MTNPLCRTSWVTDRMRTNVLRTGSPRMGALLVLIGLVVLSACSEKKAQPISAPPVPVTLAEVVEKTVPLEVRAIGNVEAYSTVSVKALIAGELTAVHFKEGQDVRKGDLLFTIDRRPFEVALEQAEANLAKDVAQLNNARAQDERYARLFKEGIVSKEQYDQFHTSAGVYEAAVQADKAAIEMVKVNLGYCMIRSPIDGRTGSLIVHQGNVVKANDVAMLVINQINPIYADFAVPEQVLTEIKKYRSAGGLKVLARPEGTDQSEEGVLSFIDNTVDRSTGTIKLKGTFSNREKHLWPGQFVNVSLTLAAQPHLVVIPTQAIQTGQSGTLVYVVKPDLSWESRPVVVGRNMDGESIIERGLQVGEKVVTDGQLRLVPGSKVEVKNPPGTNPGTRS